MAMLPAAIPAAPVVMTSALLRTVPLRSAAGANETIGPSDIPITISAIAAELFEKKNPGLSPGACVLCG
jgi:hypothetical protein